MPVSKKPPATAAARPASTAATAATAPSPASPAALSTGTLVNSAATRLPGIDGLRAVAVILVIVFHLTPGAVVGGFIGVDVFFVISGFLITGLLFREKARSGTIALVDFWRRRARRLLPALAVVVLTCSAAAFALSRVSGSDILVGLGRQVLGASTFSYNWLAISVGANYFDDTTPELFRNLWSLAIEEQFYLVWPLVVLGLAALPGRRYSVPIVLALAAASATAMALVYEPGGDPTRVYYGTDTHSFGLTLGAALAIITREWSSAGRVWPVASRAVMQTAGALALVGIIVIAVLVPGDSSFVYQGGLVLTAVLTAVAIAGLIVPGGVFGRTIDAAPMRWIGERSYGLYLWHWPVFVLLTVAFPAAIMTYETSWILGASALALTVLAAALSYRFVETPIRRNGYRGTLNRAVAAWRRSAIPRLRLSLLLVTSVSLIALTATAIVADPGVGEAQARIEAGQALIDDSAGRDSAAPTVTLPGTGGETGSDGFDDDPETDAASSLPGGDQIVAIGDSVMLAAAPQLQEAFPGISIDAVVSRQMRQAPDIVRELSEGDGVRPIVVIGLGTNGPIAVETIDTVMSLVAPETLVVLVNVQAPRGWTPGVNDILSAYAQRKRNVELANWESAIQPQIGLLASDRIHPGGPITGSIYAGAVRDAIQRLAELPPLLNPNDYGLSPRPA